ncbi:MAG: Trk system potassium transporter TrkA [Planctomycetota bacterium]|jgi:trk system potassium uptake protein TrkA
MEIIICGAGEVGSHAANVLATAGSNITVIDLDPAKLRTIADTMDVRTLEGNCAYADLLREAGAKSADLLVATTDSDEINMLTASIGKAIGAQRAIARVHHSAYVEGRGLDYRDQFAIDYLICPEFSTATAIARTLRNPAALAIEHFSRGRIDMQEFGVSDNATSIGRALSQVRMPAGSRLAAVSRKKQVLFPEAATVLEPGDRVVLVGDSDVFEKARELFRREPPRRKKVVVMGGPPMAVWLCRALHTRDWSIRLFETNRRRAEELADKLDWVTVINADPTDESVFAEEQIGLADVFVALLDDDEANIIGCVLAKANGVTQAVAVVQRSRYLDLLYHVGVDRPFSPGKVAADEIEGLLDDSPIRRMATLAEGIDAMLVRVGADAAVGGQPLHEIQLSPDWVIAAIRRGEEVWVPKADDTVQAGDSMLVIGRAEKPRVLRKLFVA